MLTRIVGTLSIAGVFALMSLPTAAYADDSTYLNEATQALQSTDVYIDPGVTGIGAEAVTALQQQIGDNDIVIVVLPASAGSDITSLQSFTTQIAERSGHETVLVALGDDFEAVSSSLPSGTAHTLADQAESSGGSYTDELANFVTNVNNTEASIEATEHPGPNVGGIVLGGIGGLVGVVLVIALVVGGIRYLPSILRQRRLNAQPKSESSDLIKQLLREVKDFMPQIDSSALKNRLAKAIVDTDQLFIRLKQSGSDQFYETTAKYEAYVKYLRNGVSKYVDIQNNPDYYDQESKPLERVASAITNYGDGVKRNIQQVTSGDLVEVEMNIKMLESNLPKKSENLFLERG